MEVLISSRNSSKSAFGFVLPTRRPSVPLGYKLQDRQQCPDSWAVFFFCIVLWSPRLQPSDKADRLIFFWRRQSAWDLPKNVCFFVYASQGATVCFQLTPGRLPKAFNMFVSTTEFYCTTSTIGLIAALCMIFRGGSLPETSEYVSLFTAISHPR